MLNCRIRLKPGVCCPDCGVESEANSPWGVSYGNTTEQGIHTWFICGNCHHPFGVKEEDVEVIGAE